MEEDQMFREVEESELQPLGSNKYDSYEEALSHMLNLLNMDSPYINNLYRVRNPFISQRNKIVNLSNYWQLGGKDNYLSLFVKNVFEEKEKIDNKISKLSKSERRFIDDLIIWLDHLKK